MHGSQPNRSDQKRRALVLTYQPGGHRMFKIDAVRDCGEADQSASRAPTPAAWKAARSSS